MAQSWWSTRFIAVLEDIGLGNRMQRGRRYARAGQVIELAVAAGAVTALVQGSRPRPYRVRIGLTAFGKGEWAQVAESLAANAWYAARLLAGEMPEDIEDAFAAVGLSLFPTSARELSMDCSCPDVAVPCKHLAAAFYLLAESFDADPFAILAWRGRDREDLLAALGALRSAGPEGPPGPAAQQAGSTPAESLDSYFDLQAEILLRDPPTTRGDSLLAQLPATGLKVRGTSLEDVIRGAYGRVIDTGDTGEMD
jgi:uncharacterized Zn finger protein